MKKKFAALALLMGFTLGLGAIAACGPVDPTDSDVNGSSGQVTPSASVTLSRTALSLDRWGSAVLTAEADAEGTIVWSSADPNVAAVDANGTVTAQKSIYVSAESDTVPGETYWLQNNILSVVFLAVGAACLIAIIVLVLVRPKKKVKADGNDTAADAAEPTEKKDVQSLKDRRKERKNKK